MFRIGTKGCLEDLNNLWRRSADLTQNCDLIRESNSDLGMLIWQEKSSAARSTNFTFGLPQIVSRLEDHSFPHLAPYHVAPVMAMFAL